MRKLLQINDFARAGLNSDIIPWDLPPSFLTEIHNIRISRGRICPFGGATVWATLPVGFIPGHIMHIGSLSGVFWMIMGKDAVLVYDGNNFGDVSSSEGYSSGIDEDLWVGCMLSNIPIINNPNHYPEYWPSQGLTIDLLPLPWNATQTWKDVNQHAKIIRSHKQFLFALELESNGDEIPDGVRWSSPADIGGLPATWDPLDMDNVAGITNLGGDGGRIIDGLSLRDAFVVYRESSISVFDYIGGQFVWRIRHLSTTVGLVASDCVVEVKGRHYFIGDGDILVNDGNTIESLIHNKIKSRFISDYDSDNFYNSYVLKNNIDSEIWFCIPQPGHIHPNIAYIFNWKDDSWSIRDIPECPSGNIGPQSTPPQTWLDMDMSWDDVVGAWSLRHLSPLGETVVMVEKPEIATQSGTLWLPDSGVPLNKFNSVIERTDFPLEGLNVVTTITRIYPHIRGNGDILIELGSQDHPGSPVRWKPGVHFNPAVDRKVDIRTTGELHCFRLSSFSSNASWEVSGIDVDYVMAGER